MSTHYINQQYLQCDTKKEKINFINDSYVLGTHFFKTDKPKVSNEINWLPVVSVGREFTEGTLGWLISA